MVRSQFYILIVGVIIIILLGYSYQVSLFSKEISNFASYYANLARTIYLKTFLERYQKLFYLDGSTIYPIKVFYECNKNSIAIPNSLDLENVSIFDRKFDYLPTSFDNYYINFTLIDKEIYNSNLCIFKGYIVQNNKFASGPVIFGEPAFFYEIDTNKKIEINKEIYIKLINNIIKELSIDFDGNCTEINYFNPDIRLKLPSFSLENVNLYYIRTHDNILTLEIENVGECPVDIRNFLYETDRIYKILPGLNVNSTSFVIYPRKSEIFNFSNFYDNFCLNSLGFKKCLYFYIKILPDYFATSCAIPTIEYKTHYNVKVEVSKDLKNPLILICESNCYFRPDIVYPGRDNVVDLIFSYICPTKIGEVILYIKAKDTITGEEYPANPVRITIYGPAI